MFKLLNTKWKGVNCFTSYEFSLREYLYLLILNCKRLDSSTFPKHQCFEGEQPHIGAVSTARTHISYFYRTLAHVEDAYLTPKVIVQQHIWMKRVFFSTAFFLII